MDERATKSREVVLRSARHLHETKDFSKVKISICKAIACALATGVKVDTKETMVCFILLKYILIVLPIAAGSAVHFVLRCAMVQWNNAYLYR